LNARLTRTVPAGPSAAPTDAVPPAPPPKVRLTGINLKLIEINLKLIELNFTFKKS
jgi:hypothetical protein